MGDRRSPLQFLRNRPGQTSRALLFIRLHPLAKTSKHCGPRATSIWPYPSWHTTSAIRPSRFAFRRCSLPRPADRTIKQNSSR